jgi:hypothetical protein
MNKRIVEIQELIAAALNALPGVFSTVQWGGRACKAGTPSKFKLLAHVFLTHDEDAVCVALKLNKQRAAAVVDDFDWITPHSFRTLGGAGWVSAEVRTKSQVQTVAQLLKESRELYPMEAPPDVATRRRKRGADAEGAIVVRRLGAIVAAKKAEGWQPAQADDFDD